MYMSCLSFCMSTDLENDNFSAKLDVFDQWCLPALRPPYPLAYSQHESNAEVRRHTQVVHHCPRSSVPVGFACFKLFGHTAHAGPEMDYYRALHAAINNSPRGWKRRRLRPAHIELGPNCWCRPEVERLIIFTWRFPDFHSSSNAAALLRQSYPG